MALALIMPTIGRKAWFYEANSDVELDATIIDVQGLRSVSVYILSRAGVPSVRHDVPLVQEGDTIPAKAHVRWMPYQLGQARPKMIEGDPLG